MMYGFWDIKCKGQFFCHFGPFLPFDTPNNPKNQNFEKIEKHLEVLSLSTTNNGHMIYGSWDIKHDRQNLSSFCSIFCPFCPVTTQKIKILKKKKKNSGRYYHFKHEYHKWKSYDVWFLRYVAQQMEFFLILDHFLPFYTPSPLTTQRIKLLKKWKKRLEISSFYTSVP